MSKRLKGRASAIGLGLAALMLGPPAHADLQVQLAGTNMGGTITRGVICVDNNTCPAGTGDDPITGVLTWVNVADGLTFTIDGLTALSQSPFGHISVSVNGTPTATGSFTIAITDNNFTTPFGSLVLTQAVTGLSTPDFGPQATFSSVGYFSSSNTLFDTSGAACLAAIPTWCGLPGIAHSGELTATAPYGLTEFITVNVRDVGSGSLQFTADLFGSAVPEPAGVALLGSILLLTVGAIRRKVSPG